MNPIKSTQIYDELISGKYINKEKIDENNLFVENDLFNEIEINLGDYKELYAKIGFSLNQSKFSYYLCDEKVGQEINKSQFKTYVLFLAISSWISKNGFSLDVLRDPRQGLSKEQLSQVLIDPEYTNWLILSEMSDAKDAINTHLVLKNILLKNNFGNFVLSNHGKWVTEKISQLGGELSNDREDLI